MNVPKELPIIYTKQILIPGYVLKIQFQVEDNSDLHSYLNEDDKNSNSIKIIGIIPKSDYGKVENIIGTVGIVRSVIQIGPVSEEFYLVVQGICRFKLGDIVSEKPLKINKIVTIENFKDLLGNENQKNELRAEFEKVFFDLLTYSEPGVINPFIRENIKTIIKSLPIHQSVEYCLKNHIHLTPADAYEVLRATNLNSLLKFVIDWLKRETIKVNKYSRFEKTGLIPLPTSVISGSNEKTNNMFKKRLSPELNKLHTVIKDSNMPVSVHNLIMKEFKKLAEMNSFNPDYSVFINHLSYVIDLPWNKSTIETLDLNKAKSVLQLNHYGMDEVKKRILQFIAVRKLNPERKCPILCFIGPPGVGKTSIAKTIADSLNRNFKRISLGGINNFSDIKGHRKTYIGAMPGCIIQAVNQAKTKNPIILLDEIDKMYKGSSGDPAAALLEVLDPEQNYSFVDSYVSLPFDLSQVMFISTANNAASIPRTLRDRMEIIYLKGYTLEEKVQIAENYLMPKIFKELKMKKEQITINKNTINTIIQNYTIEAGVRELQRKIEAICYYIAIEIVENIDKEMKNYVITPESLLIILGNQKYVTKSTLVEHLKFGDRVGIAIGLSVTSVGGKIQVIETSRLNSKNNKNHLVLTGLVGQTLKESIQIALNWIASFAEKNKLNLGNFGVHVHLPEGSIKKDGPSAGITVACALISLFWKIPLKTMIAMTGEISLQGYILPVGGVKEKILAAYNADIKTVIIPKLNLKDIKSLPTNIQEELTIISVTHLIEALNIVVPGGIEFLSNPTSNIIMPRSKI